MNAPDVGRLVPADDDAPYTAPRKQNDRLTLESGDVVLHVSLHRRGAHERRRASEVTPKSYARIGGESHAAGSGCLYAKTLPQQDVEV
jgi:hypothetical protein